MITKFQIQLMLLLFFITTNCFSASALKIDTHEDPSISEKRAVKFIADIDESRCSSYLDTPGDIESYKVPTEAISDFLSKKKNVNLKEQASKETKEELIRVSIGEKITHFRTTTDYTLRNKLAANNVLFLDESAAVDKDDPYYGHFRVLSLMDEITTQLVNSVFAPDFDIDAAIRGIKQDLFIEIKRLSDITVDMFRNCFASAYEKHQPGIVKHIQKLTISSPANLLDVVHTSSATAHEITAGLKVDGNPLPIGKLTTDSEDSKIDHKKLDEEVTEGSSKLVILSEDSRSRNADAQTTEKVEIIETITFLNATDAKATAKAKLEAAKKEKPYNETLVDKLNIEVGLARTYKTAQIAYDKDTKHKNTVLLENLNTAKKAYEDYMKAKSAEEISGDVSRKSSDASNTAGSRMPLTKRKSFYEKLTGSK